MAEPGPQKPITYKYSHQTFDAPQYAAKLCEAKRSIKAAAYWSIFDVLLVKGVVNLVCTVCNKSYSAKNPSAVCPDHYAKHQKDVASAVGSEQSGAPTTNSTKRSRAEEGPVRTFSFYTPWRHPTRVCRAPIGVRRVPSVERPKKLLENPGKDKAASCAKFQIKIPPFRQFSVWPSKDLPN
ncbi:hypothetical protein VOLCADRAFT_93674 [Volvox carteri f. nagariensis]|uniref:Uncharacterized protein n=1 Tax=Volvox carteri f. nagariensis TaxID=3068 RepID=D8U2R1_VOLCA|nr:uncharacterized protein VOLCADRAFT_93674 [Volvox carteri f. nagariensis]EFJ45851.1 hypothetical protein VOLCADRAFT_93674 [Volvox carteri f. nagariensis]|eukprot:XP_002952929.1 hypothetical protein VOLCADRAFT_93674 [Volvox carteri f. nagariensis]